MAFVKKYWWKVLTVLIMLWVLIGGMLIDIPAIPKLSESARNLFYHVPMWYVMIICFLLSAINSLRYLSKKNELYDQMSLEFVNIGLVFGWLGMITGMIWASGTWGKPWSNDPKQIGAGLCLLTYLAYLVLRNSIQNRKNVATISAVYNVFAFALIVPLLFIIPARFESLHPASGESNPLEALYSQAADFRKVSIPAMFGWVMLGIWIYNIRIRIKKLELLKKWKD